MEDQNQPATPQETTSEMLNGNQTITQPNQDASAANVNVSDKPVSVETTTSKSKKFPVKTAVLVLLTLLFAGLAVFFWMDARNAKEVTPEAVQARNQAETTEVIASLGNILVLDSTSEPTVARVENPETLKSTNPDFYKDIQVGDYLVLYPQRAIIYRKAENRIVNIAPIINAAEVQKQSEAASNKSPQEESDSAQ